ncbi:MAG TPA: Rv3235 family protein [Mycobacteriales bacterium]|jgi:hypothetical protein|nr:Rv3235 family protein [Mycobacteriales bacterium]
MHLTLAGRIDVSDDVPTGHPRLRLVPALPAPPKLYDVSQRPRRLDPRPVAESFARGVAEVMARARPVDQLRELATWEVVRIIDRAASRQPHDLRRSAFAPRLRSVHLAAPCEGVIEACAVVDSGVRTRALAFRLECRERTWRATVVQFG